MSYHNHEVRRGKATREGNESLDASYRGKGEGRARSPGCGGGTAFAWPARVELKITPPFPSLQIPTHRRNTASPPHPSPLTRHESWAQILMSPQLPTTRSPSLSPASVYVSPLPPRTRSRQVTQWAGQHSSASPPCDDLKDRTENLLMLVFF